MPELLTSRTLFRSPHVAVGDVRCTARRCGCSSEECNRTATIAFIRSGVFVKHIRGQRIVADANHAVFFWPGEVYQVSHPTDLGDRCTTFAPDPAVILEALRDLDPAAADTPDAPFPLTHAPADSPSFLTQAQMLAHLARAPASSLAVEELTCALVERLMAGAYSDRARARKRSPGPRTAAAHRDLIDAAKLALARVHASKLTLAALAREVHASPYHLSRLFRAGTGLTLQRYANRLRLRSALRRILEDRRALSAAAVEAGFFDHSHFSNAFRREFGATPSASRDHLARADRQIRKLLQD